MLPQPDQFFAHRSLAHPAIYLITLLNLTVLVVYDHPRNDDSVLVIAVVGQQHTRPGLVFPTWLVYSIQNLLWLLTQSFGNILLRIEPSNHLGPYFLHFHPGVVEQPRIHRI